MILGAVLAGGASRRFGSDKAMAEWRGKSLIAHVIDRLRPQVDALIVVGRDHAAGAIPDRPAPGLGPLGGLCAALDHARANGFDAVLTSGCDLPDLPLDLAERLHGDGPAVASGQPLLGLWPAVLAEQLEEHLAGGDRSMHGWVAITGARTVNFGSLRNINRVEDLTEPPLAVIPAKAGTHLPKFR